MYEEAKSLLQTAAEDIRSMLPTYGTSRRDLKDKAEMEQSLKNIERALGKFDAGTYGKCEKCGAQMDEDAMTSVPARLDCPSCQ